MTDLRIIGAPVSFVIVSLMYRGAQGVGRCFKPLPALHFYWQVRGPVGHRLASEEGFSAGSNTLTLN